MSHQTVAKIRVSHFPEKMTLHDLYKAFRPFGAIEKVRRSKPSLAHIQFESNEVAGQFKAKSSIGTADGQRFSIGYLEDRERIETQSQYQSKFVSMDRAAIKAYFSEKDNAAIIEILLGVGLSEYSHIVRDDERLTAIALAIIKSHSLKLTKRQFRKLSDVEELLRTFGTAFVSLQMVYFTDNKNLILEMILDYCTNLERLEIHEWHSILQTPGPSIQMPMRKPSKLIFLAIHNARDDVHSTVVSFIEQINALKFKNCCIPIDSWNRLLHPNIEELTFIACGYSSGQALSLMERLGIRRSGQASTSPPVNPILQAYNPLTKLKRLSFDNYGGGFKKFADRFESSPIERFRLVPTVHYEAKMEIFDSTILDWICSRPTIEHLTLGSRENGINDEDLQRLVSHLPSLNEAHFESPYITLAGIENMLKQAKKLEKVEVLLNWAAQDAVVDDNGLCALADSLGAQVQLEIVFSVQCAKRFRHDLKKCVESLPDNLELSVIDATKLLKSTDTLEFL